MNMKKAMYANNVELFLFIRYFSIILLILLFQSSFFLDFFISVFTYISYWFLNIFLEVKMVDGALFLSNSNVFYVVEECIASSAYILITLVFFTLPLKPKDLSKMFLLSITWFTFFNLIRILFLMWVHITFGQYYFDKYHLVFYQGLSGVVVALIIIYYLRKNKITGLYPVISDLKFLISSIKKET